MIQRGGAIVRQWKLLRLVASSRYMTVAVLAARLEVSKKTIRRDLMSLSSAGFPLWIGGTPQYNFVRIGHDWFTQSEPKEFIPIHELERRKA